MKIQTRENPSINLRNLYANISTHRDFSGLHVLLASQLHDVSVFGYTPIPAGIA